MDFAIGICGLPVKPDGSNRMWLSLSTITCRGTPCCSASDMQIASESMRPATVEPCLAIFMKTSPGLPSSYLPTVTYPSWSAIEKWWVIASRSSGMRRRTGRAAWVGSGNALPVDSGCVRLDPSR